MLRAGSSENRRAIRSALFRFHNLDLVGVHVGLNLAPQRRPRAASAQADLVDGDVHLAEDRKRILQTESHAFQNRADDMLSMMRRRDADERTARIGVEVRSAL